MEGFYEFEHREVQRLTLKEHFGSKGSGSDGAKGKTTIRQGFAIHCTDAARNGLPIYLDQIRKYHHSNTHIM